MVTMMKERGNFLPIHEDDPKRILILMSNTGGGHRAAAEAIKEALEYLYGAGVTVSIVDAWENHVAWPVSKIGKSYGWIVNEAVWMWKAFWLLDNKPRLVDTFLASVYPLIAPGLLKLFRRYRPDVIVSVHPLITQFPLMVLRHARLKIPFITVVTDMVKGYHTWYNPRTTLCLVPTEPARKQALENGVPVNRVEVVGQPVALKFAHGISEEKNALRQKLGLDPHRPAILLVGGGEGFGPMMDIARQTAQTVSQAQLMIVAGRNQSLKKKLEAVDWEIPTTIFGFVDNMPELMGAADVFISKAGPGCISEAFVAELPLILFDYIPGQEEGNVEYVLKHKAGAYVTEAQEIAALLSEWLTPNNPSLMEMTQNAARLARPEAALTIAERIYEQAHLYQSSPTYTEEKQTRLRAVPKRIPGLVREQSARVRSYLRSRIIL